MPYHQNRDTKVTTEQDIDNMVRRLYSRLRVEMNGAVSASMRERGMEYRLNYGVSIPTIEDVVEEYRGNNALALRLYESDIREIRLAAIYIVDPEQVTTEHIEAWRAGVINREIAEQLALKVLSKVPTALETAIEWSKEPNDSVCYCAMLSISHAVRRKRQSSQKLSREQIASLRSICKDVAARADRGGMLWHGAVTMLAAVAASDERLHEEVSAIVTQQKQSQNRYLSGMASEVEWQI